MGMNVFVARQPIFDRQKKIYAYELLFRTGETNGFPNIDGGAATTSLLSSSFFTVGIDKITAGRMAFINFTEDLIARGIPQLFPTGKLMVEILEDVEPGSEIVEACKVLKEKGYSLALDDFVYSRKFDELLHLSDIIKIDFRLTPPDRLERMVATLQQFNCRLLAEKVETYEEFARALDLGFDYFQGYFFAKPEVLRNKDLSSSQVTILQLLSELNAADREFDVESLERLVSRDISITYKLLNYINSAHFCRLQPISSIGQAISYLGESGFKMFLSLIAASLLAEGKPSELVRASIIRARFLELIGIACRRDGSEMFLLGLFSLIDAMLDRSIHAVLNTMHLSENINAALIGKSGDLFPYLRLVETYEKGSWIAARFALKKIGIDEKRIADFYVEAITWADAFEQCD